MRLEGKVAIITGGASGIGRAATVLFAREGARVVIGDVDEGGMAETAAAARDGAGEVVAVRADVSEPESARALVAAAVERFGRLDVLYNNAAISRDVPASVMSEEDWEATFAVNVRGTFLCTKYALPVMVEAGGGSVITTGSCVAMAAMGGSAYSASKGAVIAFTRSVAADYGRFNIRANCLCPGIIPTPMLAPYMSDEILAEFQRCHLLPRLGRPEDVAYTALYLASDESSYVTGAVIPVDGGIGTSNRPRLG